MDCVAEAVYTVLINREGQYSLGRWGIAPPLGWRATGTVGTRAQCTRYLDAMWSVNDGTVRKDAVIAV